MKGACKESMSSKAKTSRGLSIQTHQGKGCVVSHKGEHFSWDRICYSPGFSIVSAEVWTV